MDSDRSLVFLDLIVFMVCGKNAEVVRKAAMIPNISM